MRLYHSSEVLVSKPDISHSRDYLDFGKGFYLTSIHDQSVRYAQRFLRRQREAWLNTYEFEFEPSEWNILYFDCYDKGWLSFVANCRAGKDDTDYDLVVGGIANDKVIQTLDRYFLWGIDRERSVGTAYI